MQGGPLGGIVDDIADGASIAAWDVDGRGGGSRALPLVATRRSAPSASAAGGLAEGLTLVTADPDVDRYASRSATVPADDDHHLAGRLATEAGELLVGLRASRRSRGQHPSG